MKNYTALRIISNILAFIGYVIITLGVLFLIFGVLGNANNASYANPYVSHNGVILVIIAISLSVVLSGILIVASGQLIEAVVDIAKNTSYLPAIAKSSDQTVSFFERVNARASPTK